MKAPQTCPKCSAPIKTEQPNYTVYQCGTCWYNRVSIERAFKCHQAREIQLEKELAKVKADFDELMLK